MLSFTQVNLHKTAQATLLLGREMEGKTQSIAFITEPHTVQGKVTGLPGGTVSIATRTQGTGAAPRAAIIASRDLRLNEMTNLCTRDCAVASAKLHGRLVLLASIYLDINKPVVQEWLTRIMDTASRLGRPIILAIDSNAHSSMYGPDSNARGDQIEDFVLQHGLEIHNTGDAPTFEVRRGNVMVQTHIDITLSRDLHFNVENWRLTDHTMPLITIHSGLKAYPP